MAKTLSILIPTLKCREAYLSCLMDRLWPQLSKEIEVLTEPDSGQASIGEKRNRLVERAKGAWLVHLDDDDLVPGDYVRKVVAALASDPDAVGYLMGTYNDGFPMQQIQCSIRFSAFGEASSPIRHTNPVRASIAKGLRFNHADKGEDTDYILRLAPLLRTESYIDEELYLYYFRPNKAQEVSHANR